MSKSRHSVIAPLLPTNHKYLTSDVIATLWSSYGHIYRLNVIDEETNLPKTLILKSIRAPPIQNDDDESHLRKLLSYEVERYFYSNLSSQLPEKVKVAHCYPLNTASKSDDLLLEDLSVNYPHPARGSLGLEATQCVLRWLAGFHATFWNVHLKPLGGSQPLHLVPPPSTVFAQASASRLTESGHGIWQQGTYWYLDTRQEEMASVDDSGDEGWLVLWADKVNQALEKARSKHATLVHGDVKGANIVFSHPPFRKPDESQPLLCALYDMQYVGINPPTHDLVYFLGTSVSSSLLAPAGEQQLLDYYYQELARLLPAESTYSRAVFDAHWELSIVDWVRFMAGWGYWGNDRWAIRRAREVTQRWEAGGWSTLLNVLVA